MSRIDTIYDKYFTRTKEVAKYFLKMVLNFQYSFYRNNWFYTPARLIFLLLLLQNILIFNKHYFYDVGIPWDFVETYAALPYFWIESLKNGVTPSWIPFQGMGYPLYSQLQSGYLYPPNWLFVIFDISYTIHNAVIMHGIHILFGSLGAVFLSKLLGLNWREALLSGVLYQGFGAFYSNAEHVDIIRSYAFTPWIIAPFVANWNSSSKLLVFSILALPVWIFFAWTGGYIGITIATLFVSGIVLFFRVLFENNHKKIGFYTFFLLFTSILISAVYILPALLDSEEYIRSNAQLTYDYFHWIDVFSCIYPINYLTLPHDISMRSISIGMVGLCLILIGIKYIKEWNFKLILIFVISTAMASGILHSILIKYLPQLGLSRFTMGDYRGMMGLSLIIIASSNLRYLNHLTINNYKTIALIVLGFIIIGNYVIEINSPNHMKDVLLLSFFIFLTLLSFLTYRYNIKLGLGLIIIVCILDFARIHYKKNYWYTKNITNYIETTFLPYKDSKVKLSNEFLKKTNRPARLDITARPLSYSGYYNGNYLLNDYGGSMHLKRHASIRNNQLLKQFAMLPWTAIELSSMSIDENFLKQQTNNIKLVSYGMSKIIYELNLPKQVQIVENEIFWNGWKGYIIDQNEIVISEIQSFDFHGFRAWNLPAGQYRLLASFVPPYQKISLYVSAIGLFFWILIIYKTLDKRRKKFE